MSKKSPTYETGWHTTGTLEMLPSIEQVARRLDGNEAVELHGLNLSGPHGWWSYDAVWMTQDGARVRGRLNIHNQHPSQEDASRRAALDPHAYDPSSDPMDGYFHAFAEADRPWDPAWPSPLHVFLERKIKPSYAAMSYGKPNPLHMKSSKNLPGLIATLADLSWIATVFTHDGLDSHECTDEVHVHYETPLISRLPSSLYGRVLDVRVLGNTVREKLNRILPKYGTYLPEGGVAILLSRGRLKGIAKADLSFELDKPFVEGGDIAPVSKSLSEFLTAQVLRTDADAVEEIRENWTLLTEREKAERDSDLLKAATSRIEHLEHANVELLGALKESQEFNERFRRSGEALIEELQKTTALKDEAISERNKLRGELDRLLRMIRDSDLGEAIAAREKAEEEVEAAEELLDEQNRKMTGLRRENGRLRGELVRLGSTFTSVSTLGEKAAPPTWDDLFARVPDLEYVVLGDVESGVDKLRRQTQEENWLNRTWETLLALEEYARLKKERGAADLPHFHAYLLDPQAEYTIPRTRCSNTESKGVMMNGRFVAARTFPIPRQVDPSGKVVMEAHVRIGSGKPPAPRLHFHDDTNGNTGKIYIGHIGPHLPNYQTN